MIYKHKLYLLSGILGLLALVYALTLVFDPERVGTRTAAFTWLDSRFLDQIDGLEIRGPTADVTLVRKNNAWFVSDDNAAPRVEYPARQFRIDDLLGTLTRRGAWPVQAASVSAHERLGLTEAAASRVIVRGGPGLPLLDLLAGNGDLTGRDIYLRKAGQNEVRSGEDKLSGYIAGSRSSWYNLRLFPDSEDGSLDVDIVQRLTVYPPAVEGATAANPAEPLIFTRAGEGWALDGGTVAALDKNKVDTYIRGILNTEGEDFVSAGAASTAFKDGRVVLEFGDGSVRTIYIDQAQGESNRRYAVVSGSPYVYALTSWSVDRIFREASFFEKQ
jgi:hypothetical protein